MKEFKPMLLGDILTFQRGFDITKKEQNEGEIPIVSSSGISSFHNQSKVKAPGVVIGRKGTLGTVHYLKEKFWPHDTTLWVKDFKGNSPRFISYFLKSLNLEIFDVGSSNPTLNRNHLHKIQVKFPELKIQKKIEDFISIYDDAIENNNTQINIVSALIDELYKEWFVRFRFPNHKNTNFHKGTPERWEIKSILDESQFRLIKPNLEIFEGEKKYYATAQVDGINLLSPTDIISYKNKPSRAQYKPVDNSVWFARMKNTYKVISVPEKNSKSIKDLALSSGFVGFKTSKEYFPFLYCLIRSENFHDTKDVYCTGATQESLTNSGMKHIKILMPEPALITEFSKIIEPFINQINNLQFSRNVMETKKEVILKRMLSGKIVIEKLDNKLPTNV